MKLLVIGDTLLDEYLYGKVEKISPEAPVPILQYNFKKEKLGGACNVAANIRTLSKTSPHIDYFGFASQNIVNMLEKFSIKFKGVSVTSNDILQKTRYVSDNHHLLRLDKGRKYKKEEVLVSNKLIKSLEINDYDLIIISDYDKGTFSEDIAEYIFENYKGYIIIDLKKYRTWISDFDLSKTIIKCNEKEFKENKIDMFLYSNVMYIIQTLGSQGFKVMKPHNSQTKGEWYHVPAKKIDGNVIDVVGAGDVFLAGMVAEFVDTKRFNVANMTNKANKAAAAKVQKFGTNTISAKELENE